MGIVKGTGRKPTSRRLRLRIPKGPNPSVVVAVLTPAAVLAPETWERAVCAAAAIGAAFVVGYFEGRAAKGRDVIEVELASGLRRDVPPAQ